MNDKTRKIFGIALILLSLFIGGKGININSKIPKPDPITIQNLDKIDTKINPVDSAKLSGFFNAIGNKFLESNISNNIKLQYFIANIGLKAFGQELKGKYSEFSKTLSNVIENIAGPQVEETPLTNDEKQNLSKLFDGLSWKLYNKENDNLFEEYKNKTLSILAEYNNVVPPKPPQPDDIKCQCDGSGYITHGDGHKTKCPCENCKCSLKSNMPLQNENKQIQQPIIQSNENNSNNKRGILRRFR